jgi:hypothetical protein
LATRSCRLRARRRHGSPRKSSRFPATSTASRKRPRRRFANCSTEPSECLA